MNFFQKVVARNIFKYKKKFFMNTIGIAGCTALLVAGLGLKQSIISIVDTQYGDIFRYDLELTVKEDCIDNIVENAYIEDFLNVSKENITVVHGEEERDITLLTIPDVIYISEYINLKDRGAKAALELDDSGVIISEKLAETLDVEVGDKLKFANSNLGTYDVKINGIAENYIGHYMYMTESYAKQIGEDVPCVNQLLICLENVSSTNKENISNELTQNNDVISFAFTTRHAESFESMTASLDTVIIVLIISAAVLAFVVLDNLTTINISERYRKIATIKVLGFDDFKVSQYIYRENRMLTLMRLLLGLILGKALLLFIIVTVEMEDLMFGRELYASSDIIVVILTFIFAMLVNVIMHCKLQKIELVEFLEAVE